MDLFCCCCYCCHYFVKNVKKSYKCCIYIIKTYKLIKGGKMKDEKKKEREKNQ